MSITIKGDEDLGAGNNPTITILLNKAQIMDWNRSGGSNDLVTETVSFKAFFNAEDTAQSSVKIRNLTASYGNVPSA
jgi:hypothetical protein